MSLPISSVYNDGYVAEALERYRRDPASVDESWRQFFQLAERLGGAAGASAPPASCSAKRKNWRHDSSTDDGSRR